MHTWSVGTCNDEGGTEHTFETERMLDSINKEGEKVCVKRGTQGNPPSEFAHRSGVFHGLVTDEEPISKIFFHLEDSECLVTN